MKTLETNDWLVMNSIIYKIYTTGDFDAMRTQFLEQIKTVIDFDSADFIWHHQMRKKIWNVRYSSTVMKTCQIFMRIWITAVVLCSVAGVWYTGKLISYLMRKEFKPNIIKEYISQITGIMRYK